MERSGHCVQTAGAGAEPSSCADVNDTPAHPGECLAVGNWAGPMALRVYIQLPPRETGPAVTRARGPKGKESQQKPVLYDQLAFTPPHPRSPPHPVQKHVGHRTRPDYTYERRRGQTRMTSR